ncbi:hypothetical protein [Prevotella sp.]|uniref:hypothetical protein n=1 Tax=Prevotella sp. TaxID=59823 RepID=UPI0027E38DE3|nr:hypothetical protein [Prevotella sp.]
MKTKTYPGKTIGTLLIVLLLMPLGHALMILMEHYLAPTVLHYSAFAMGFLGLVITIWGVFVKGDTRQTCFGLAGSVLFWTGWVEFLLAYYAQRYGVHCDLVGNGIVETVSKYVNGVAVDHSFTINGSPLESFSRAELKELRGSRPEYLIMPATFGMWMMFVVLYLFCTRNGCLFLHWIQKHCGINNNVELRPMAYHPSIVMFMEWNIMMWGLYLLLMFCYDPVFLGDHHPVTYIIAAICLIGSALMFKKQLRIANWGRSIRMAYATVIVFWTFVEVAARNGMFKEIWVDPMHHVAEMVGVLVVFVALVAGYWLYNAKDNHEAKEQ